MANVNLQRVEFEHVQRALAGQLTADTSAVAETLQEFVATVLIQTRDHRPMQEVLAGILREAGWTVLPPACACTRTEVGDAAQS
jgi:hypothetical protein